MLYVMHLHVTFYLYEKDASNRKNIFFSYAIYKSSIDISLKNITKVILCKYVIHHIIKCKPIYVAKICTRLT